MSSLSKKPSKSNPPFYFYEGKGWKIETKVKIGDEYRKLSRSWYRTLAEAKADFQNQVLVLKQRHTREATRGNETSWDKFKDRYLDFRRSQVRGSTLNRDKLMFSTVFDPLFWGMNVGDAFKREGACSVQSRVKKWNVNRKNKNKALSYYLAMLEYAFEHEYLEQDSDYRKCKSEIVMIKSTEQDDVLREKTILTSAQCDALLGAIDDTKDKMLTTLMAETGLRIGEAVVARVQDFDFEKMELSVSRTSSVDEFGQRKEYNRTKTKLGLRTIPLSPRFVAIVASYCKAFDYRGADLLFPSDHDRSCTMDVSAYRNRLSRYCATAGVPRITPHSLRHTFCTRLSERCSTDADRIARSYIMGHSVVVDEEVYAAHNQLQNAKKLIGGE